MISMQSVSKTKYSELEKEVMLLLAAWELILDLVNYDKLEMDYFKEGTVMFQNDAQRRLFHVLFADFLSAPRYEAFRPGMTEKDKTESFMRLLTRVVEKPLLSTEVKPLKKAIDNIDKFFGEKFVLNDMWLPTIDRHATIKIDPKTLLLLCGNHVKHSFSRLEIDARALVKVFKENDIDIGIDEVFMILPELLEWFLIVYYQNEKSIVNLLNELRWGLYRYIREEFERSFFWKEPYMGVRQYGFNVPKECATRIGSHCYWELMNAVRREPNFPLFENQRALRLIFDFKS
ncbi:MAG: hypothetical protein DKT66_28365 [Candidatus Melainabacteria bacterium]|jgi:hypothetical protein|nr:MAG: hypothetical protein DKT66_28365 [Candidatus Melainabacteria bacterium]